MLQIQQCALQIHSDNPQKIYFFTGPEYGVKSQYIDVLVDKYGNVEHHDNLQDLVASLSKKSLIPRIPTVYICRYDSKFISALTKDLADKVNSLSVPGVIIGIYDDDKSEKKLDKWFSSCTVRINRLTPNIQLKHLSKENPKLNESQIKAVIAVSSGYYQARLVCEAVSFLDDRFIRGLTPKSIIETFHHNADSDVMKFKTSVAARNVKSALREVDKFKGDVSSLLYDILSTCLEILKMLNKKYGESFVTPYLKLWDFKSAKAMFDVCYNQLVLLRTVSSYKPEIAVTYVCLLLKFQLR